MDSEISVERVSLRFRLYHEKGADLKQALTSLLRGRRRAAYSEFWALNEVSLHIAHGERVGIVGHNGAGKSTLLKAMTGIYWPTSGTVAVRGRICSLLEIGAGFNHELSGRENIYLHGAIYGLHRQEIAQMVDEIISFTGLGEFIDTPVKYYSTGMYMRLAFAAATAVKPEILILDEMFAGGDAEFIAKAAKRMQEVFDVASIIVFVSHQLELIEKFCQRVIWMDHGRVRADGPTENILTAYRSVMQGGQGDAVAGRGLDGGAADPGRRARLLTVRFEDADGNRRTEFAAGMQARLLVEFATSEEMASPIIGFLFKDAQGLPVMGENTCASFDGRAPRAAAGDRVRARFAFTMPPLAAGAYDVTVALVEGVQASHQSRLWVDGASRVVVPGTGTNSGKGVLALPLESVSLEVGGG
jgi:ABC-type polysaccharide/polyol phosphate transport system ATPase subunit